MVPAHGAGDGRGPAPGSLARPGEAFERHPGDRELWQAFPRSAKRAILEWIVQGKRPETRARRGGGDGAGGGTGQRANQWTPKR
ncbi:MAG: YdeI/OmpD-associated family protein [Actinomycetota bacterium]|nr:YdeI/OmpD-associated family protein [Actinomycetota bacterium]